MATILATLIKQVTRRPSFPQPTRHRDEFRFDPPFVLPGGSRLISLWTGRLGRAVEIFSLDDGEEENDTNNLQLQNYDPRIMVNQNSLAA